MLHEDINKDVCTFILYLFKCMKISVATKITIFSFAALCISATHIFSYKPIPVSFTSPKDWPAPAYNFSGNPLTKEGIALGKKLFYDPALSSDNTVSCATCQLCARQRDVIVGFPAHGTRKRVIDIKLAA